MKANKISAWITGAGLLFVVAIIVLFMQWSGGSSILPSSDPPKVTTVPQPLVAASQPVVSAPIPERSTIDYDRLESDEGLRNETNKRKSQYGLRNGVDMVVQAEDSIRVGGTTIKVVDILDKIAISKGQVVEKNLDDTSGTVKPKDDQVYGIYVIQSGDNIWNIHFQFLRDYFDSRGIMLSPLADEPTTNGTSSGIGKILKFSEKMVAIYNIQEERLESGINRIQPLNKLVVYNMTHIFDLLNQVDREKVNSIRFDGETLWMPAEQ